MKRLLVLCLCLALLISVCGCGSTKLGSEESPEPEQTAEPETISEQDAEKMVDLVDAVSELEERGGDRQSVEEYLAEQDWIVNVSETPDGGLTCVTSFGVTGVWTPEQEGYLGGGSAAAEQMERSAAKCLQTPKKSDGSAECYEIRKIALLCPYASEDSNFIIDGYEYLGSVLNKTSGSELTVFKDEEVSLDLLKHLDEYDMVWFYSHGALSNVFNSAWAITDTDPYTMTGEFANSVSAYILLSEDFFAGRTVIDISTGRIGVGGSFYEHYYSENELDGVFFHFASCSSMRTDKLANGIRSRGAAWVEGWTNSVSFSNDYAQFTHTLTNLITGDTIEQALKDAVTEVRSDTDLSKHYQTDTKLTGYGETDYRIYVDPEIREEIQQELDDADKQIPADAFAFNGHTYKIYSGVCTTWEEAKAYCEDLGGYLAVITTQEENDALFAYMTSQGYENAYFGFTDSASEGNWVWVNGESVSYTNWHADEPNNEQGTENYAMFYWKFPDGTWNDGNFVHGTQADEYIFICEWD